MPTRRRTAARQDADDVGAPADLEIEAFLRVVGANLAPVLLREGGEGEDLVCGVGQHAGSVREARLELCDDTRMLRPDLLRRGLLKMLRTIVATIGCALFGTRVRTVTSSSF